MKVVSVKGALFLSGFFLFLVPVLVFAETIDLDQDGIPDHEDEEVIVLTDQSLSAGEYVFHNLIVASNTVLTLVGDPDASGDFKGVKIIANNITLEIGSSISANGTGYTSAEESPGAGDNSRGGYGYGGNGGDWHYATDGAIGGVAYGSAFEPKDLGSGESPSAGGGGAIWLAVSGTLENKGIISANGVKHQASGGSIYIRTASLAGSGMFTANGARCYGFHPYSGAGGGGRIAVYYEESSFGGNAEATRGGSGTNSTCRGERTGEDGTIVFVDTINSDLYLYDRLLFQTSSSPYEFNTIVLSKGATISSEPDVSITARTMVLDEGSSFDTDGVASFLMDSLLIDDASTFISAEGQSLRISALTIQNGGVAQLGRGETLDVFDSITLEESQIIAAPMHILHLEARDITIDETSAISATGAGYPPMSGPGYNDSGAGASHGGLGERGTPVPVYGSETEPVDFGSGGSSDAYGGGGIRMIVSGTLENDGTISADATLGKNGASGGSIYVTTNTLSGSGAFTALGGNTRGYTADIGAGGGGRIAVYYEESNFTGTTSAKGGDRYIGGAIQQWYYAEDGTVVLSQKEVQESIDPLLLQYLPILRMHPEEDYFPMNVDAFVEASALWDDKGILPDEIVKAYDSENPVTIEFLETFSDTEDFYLAFSDPANSKSIDIGKGKEKYDDLVETGKVEVTVYAHRMEDSYEDSFGQEREFTVLQYWYFYAMNDWRTKGGFNDHEGDWESVFVFLDEDEEPKYVAFSAHHNDGEAEGWNLAQYDSVRREWGEIEADDNQVHSYVALGSHANYPEVGDHPVPSLLPNIDYIDQTSFSGVAIDFSDEIVIQMNDLSGFLLYKGKWGAVELLPGRSAPQGPNFIEVSGHKRFHNPIEWAGINAIDEIETEEPATTFTFQGSGIRMNFENTTVPIGTTFRISPYREPIIFGTLPQNTTLLPRSWEINSSLVNDSFNTKVSFPIEDGMNTENLNVYLFDPVSDFWKKENAYIDESEDFIVLETTHFSRYALGYEGETEVEAIPVITPSGGGGGSRMSKASEAPLTDALIVEEISSSEKQINLLVQQALVYVMEYILESYKSTGFVSVKDYKVLTKLLHTIMESLRVL